MRKHIKRANGKGSVTKRENGYYQARWRYDGQLYTRNTETKNREEALKVLERFMRPFRDESKIAVEANLLAKVQTAEEQKRINDEKDGSTTLVKGIKLTDMVDRFLADVSMLDVVDGTRKFYRTICRSFTDWMSQNYPKVVEMRQVTKEMVRKYLKEYANGVCPQSYNNALANFGRVFRILGEEAGCKTNPFEGEEKRKVDKSRGRRPLTNDELKRLIGVLKNDEERLLFGFGLNMGLRISDCALMRKDYIHLDEGFARFKPIKVKKYLKEPLMIPINAELRVLIEKVLAKNPKGVYILPEFARMYKSSHITKYLSDIFEKAGITVSVEENGKRRILTGFHSLRHTFVTNAINSGMNALLVQRLVGHSNLMMSDHYYHQNEQVLRDGVARLPRVFETNENAPVCASDKQDGEIVEQAKNASEGVSGASMTDLSELVSVLDAFKGKNETLADCLKRLIAVKQAS